jgi:hypothetical protein
MTFREAIDRRVRKVQIITLVSFAVFFGSIFLVQMQNHLWPITVIGFAGFFVATLYRIYGIRCPRCSGQIGMSITQFGAGFSMPTKFRFCPFCGVALDNQMEQP